MSEKIRVLIADDSPTARASLRSAIEGDGTLVVIAEARDGEEAVALCVQHKPDVALLDVHMPGRDGLSATKEIMTLCPLPVVITSGANMDKGSKISFQALAAGAVDIIAKPRAGEEGKRAGDAQNLRQTLRLMAEVKVVRRRSLGPDEPVVVASQPVDVIAIAASTGGPAALAKLLRDVPAPIGVPVLVVQHIMEGFVENMCEWLASTTGHQVRVARPNDRAEPGVVLVAPDNHHLTIERNGRVRLGSGSPVLGHRPSANELFASVARVFAKRGLGIVLTGMGTDGADGLELVHRAGGITFAEAESSCAVYGMPKAAVDLGCVDHLLPLWRLGPHLKAILGTPRNP